MRVGLIGVGHVGASVAMALLQGGIARELRLHDRDAARAEGEAMDLAHGAPFYPRAQVHAVALEAALDADVIVFAAGRNGRPGESRLALLADNVRVAAEVGHCLAGCRAVVVVISNPVDVLTRVLLETSGLPAARVIGTGTVLDTARLRQTLGRTLGVDARSVHAQVLGEHGESEFVQWSAAQVGGRPLRGWPGWSVADESRIGHEVRTAADEIIQRKGVTNHAIALVTADLVGAIVHDERRVLTVSRRHDRLGGVVLSLPAVLGSAGAETVVDPSLDGAETAALQHSAAVLQQAWAGVTP